MIFAGKCSEGSRVVPVPGAILQQPPSSCGYPIARMLVFVRFHECKTRINCVKFGLNVNSAVNFYFFEFLCL